MLDPLMNGEPFPDIWSAVHEALLQIPGVRFILGIASPEWRPLWALTWIVALVYVMVRIVEWIQRTALERRMAIQQARPIVRPLGDVTPGAGELLLAPADSTPYQVPDDPALATPTEPARPTRTGVPRAEWATRAALATALLGIIVVLVGGSRDDVADAPPPAPDRLLSEAPAGQETAEQPVEIVQPSFAFEARDWRSARGVCIATLEVTGSSAPMRTLTMYVMGAGGTILGKDQIRVPGLTAGAFHEFRFRGVDCGAITDWQVQGQ